jgi:hypothetical protein
VVVARWSFFGYNRCMVRTAHWGWTWRLPTGLIQSNPVHIPVYTPLRCSEWYSTRPSPDTLERAVVVLWYHCGTLRLAENISGVGSQQLSPTGTYTPTTRRDTSSDTLELSTTYPQVLNTFTHMHYTAYWSSNTFQYSMLFFYNIPKKTIAIPTSTAIILYMMTHKQNFFPKCNFFPTLNSALESEGLLESWALNFPPLSYDSTYSYTFDDGSKHGHYVSVYRDSGGRYERPVHYKR